MFLSFWEWWETKLGVELSTFCTIPLFGIEIFTRIQVNWNLGYEIWHATDQLTISVYYVCVCSYCNDGYFCLKKVLHYKLHNDPWRRQLSYLKKDFRLPQECLGTNWRDDKQFQKDCCNWWIPEVKRFKDHKWLRLVTFLKRVLLSKPQFSIMPFSAYRIIYR